MKAAEGDEAALQLLRDGRRARRRGPPDPQTTLAESRRLVDLAYVGTHAHAKKQREDKRRAEAEGPRKGPWRIFRRARPGRRRARRRRGRKGRGGATRDGGAAAGPG